MTLSKHAPFGLAHLNVGGNTGFDCSALDISGIVYDNANCRACPSSQRPRRKMRGS